MTVPKVNYFLLELIANDDTEYEKQVFFAPANWTELDSDGKRLVVKYLLPPFDGEDELMLNALVASQMTPPAAWTKYPVLKVDEASE